MSVIIEKPGVIPVVQKADHLTQKPQGQWTYEDYATLPDDGNRYEIISGVLYQMPAPNTKHQYVSNLVAYHLTANVQMKKRGLVFSSPLDVKLAGGHTVQPDIVVILKANEAIIKEKFVEGTPDLIVEISSPGTAGYDRREKQQIYAESGVKEYWLIDSASQTVEVLELSGTAYQTVGVFTGVAKLPSKIIPKFPVPVEQFFE
jgi:Uma2 family endonuclease